MIIFFFLIADIIYTFDNWHTFGNTTGFIGEIYSAYYDDRFESTSYYKCPMNFHCYGSVIIVTILYKKYNTMQLKCNLLYENGDLEKELILSRYEILDDFRPRFAYGTSVLRCILKQSIFDKFRVPKAVQLIHSGELSNNHNHNIFTLIRYNPVPFISNTLAPMQKFVVCVPVLQRNLSNSVRFVEFVEFYKILGVTKFYFYNNSISSDVGKVLKYYEKKNAQILKWNIHANSTDIFNGAFTASFNDCYMRASFIDNAKYIAMVDVDEIIMPLTEDNTLLDFLAKIDRENISSFNFKNVFLQEDSILSEKIHNRNHNFLYTNILTKRTEPWNYHLRSKYIVKGKYVLTVNNHYAPAKLRGTVEYLVNANQGLLFHYRDRTKSFSFNHTERRALRYVEKLSENVDRVCNEIFNSLCKLTLPDSHYFPGYNFFTFNVTNAFKLYS